MLPLLVRQYPEPRIHQNQSGTSADKSPSRIAAKQQIHGKSRHSSSARLKSKQTQEFLQRNFHGTKNPIPSRPLAIAFSTNRNSKQPQCDRQARKSTTHSRI